MRKNKMVSWIKKIFTGKKEPIEFYKDSAWMLNKDLTPNLRNLKRCREFQALMDTKQSEKWHKEGNAFKHTLLVAKRMHDMITTNSVFNQRDKRILMVAALCHDLGKATTTYWDEKEKDWKCRNHGAAGERITRELLWNEEITTREEICWLVRWHMNFHHITQKPFMEQFQEIIRLSQGFSTVEKLLILNVADSRGSLSEENSEDKINAKLKQITDIAMANNCYIKPYEAAKPKTTSTMYVMIGLPGSGKDTYIKKFLPGVTTVCRDDIREEITDGKIIGRKLMLSPDGERQVTNIVDQRIATLSYRHQDFIVNQTSLKKKYRTEMKELALKHGSPRIVYVYVEAPTIEECKERRGHGKWDSIIDRMWADFEFPDKSECHELIIYKN